MKGTIKEIIEHLKENYDENTIAIVKTWTVEDVCEEFTVDETTAEEMLEHAELHFDPETGINLHVLERILEDIKDMRIDDAEEEEDYTDIENDE